MTSPPDWLTDPLYRNVYTTIATRHAPDIGYDEWLDHWFGRPVVSQGFPWFADVSDLFFRPALSNAYARRLFANAARDLEHYHDDQIGAGLWLMVSNGEIHVDWPDVPIAEREACLLATADLFRDLFAVRCAPALSNGPDERPVINTSCYMWWENMTHIAFPGDPALDRMIDACLQVMEDTLAVPHVAVQEAALHGLGHSVRNSDRARSIIERFLAESSGLDPQLERYARAALTGCIQ